MISLKELYKKRRKEYARYEGMEVNCWVIKKIYPTAEKHEVEEVLEVLRKLPYAKFQSLCEWVYYFKPVAEILYVYDKEKNKAKRMIVGIALIKIGEREEKRVAFFREFMKGYWDLLFPLFINFFLFPFFFFFSFL